MKRRDEPPRGLETGTTGTLTTTGREAGMISVQEAGVEDSLETGVSKVSRGRAPVTIISPAAEEDLTTGAGVRMTGTLEDQDTSLVAVVEEAVMTTITGEMTTGVQGAVEETTGMIRGADMETTPMEDTEILLMDMATPLMDTATHLTDIATLGQAGSLTLDLVAVTLTTLGLVLSPTGNGEEEAEVDLVVTQGAEWASSLGQWVCPWGALACLASGCSPSEAPLQCSKTSLGPEASGALRQTDT